MITMVMRVDDVLDGLVRDGLDQGDNLFVIAIKPVIYKDDAFARDEDGHVSDIVRTVRRSFNLIQVWL
jgi:hypothetical protein